MRGLGWETPVISMKTPIGWVWCHFGEKWVLGRYCGLKRPQFVGRVGQGLQAESVYAPKLAVRVNLAGFARNPRLAVVNVLGDDGLYELEGFDGGFTGLLVLSVYCPVALSGDLLECPAGFLEVGWEFVHTDARAHRQIY